MENMIRINIVLNPPAVGETKVAHSLMGKLKTEFALEGVGYYWSSPCTLAVVSLTQNGKSMAGFGMSKKNLIDRPFPLKGERYALTRAIKNALRGTN